MNEKTKQHKNQINRKELQDKGDSIGVHKTLKNIFEVYNKKHTNCPKCTNSDLNTYAQEIETIYREYASKLFNDQGSNQMTEPLSDQNLSGSQIIRSEGNIQ